MRVGSLAASALVSGDVNAVLTSSNAVLNLAAGGLDVVIIGALFQRPEGDFMARPEFKRAEDLKGKLIAIQSIGGGGLSPHSFCRNAPHAFWNNVCSVVG
jgi:ABC-type nitrate/sulfonate/bicarbonate transport system substrate-binding protein